MPVTDEEIAKIIDPEAFGLPSPYVGDNWLSDRDEARAKAAAIRKMFGDEQSVREERLKVVLKGIEVYSSSHDDARGMAAKALLDLEQKATDK